MAVYLHGGPASLENVGRFCKVAMQYKDVRPWRITLYQHFPHTLAALDALADICNRPTTTTAQPQDQKSKGKRKVFPSYQDGVEAVHDAWHADKATNH